MLSHKIKKWLWLPLFVPCVLCAENQPLTLYADFLYMRRNMVDSTNLGESGDGGTVLTTEVLLNDLGWQPGVRVGGVANFNEKYSLDFNFIYMRTWHTTSNRSNYSGITFPFVTADYDVDFTDVPSIQAKYRSRLRQIEAVVLYFISPRWENYFSINALFGVKAMLIPEDFSIAYYPYPDISHYTISTNNRLGIAELGLGFQARPYKEVAIEFVLKGGIGFNAAKQKTFLGDQNDTVQLRKFHGSTQYRGAVTCDLWGKLIYKPNDHFQAYLGYQMLFATGIALAIEQISLNTGATSGKRVVTHGNYMAQGLYLGGAFSF